LPDGSQVCEKQLKNNKNAPINTDEQSECRTNSLDTICSFDCNSAFTIVKLKKPYAAFLITIGIIGRDKELFTEDINPLKTTSRQLKCR